jgi:hypothetical protein
MSAPPRSSSLSVLALFALASAAPGCSGCGKSTAGADAAPGLSSASVPTASVAPTAQTSAAASAPSAATKPAAAACVVKGDVTVVDQGVRADTGITLGLATYAIGYAKGQGTPKAATFDDAGVVTVAEVSEPFEALDRKPETSVRRVVQRVTPLDAKDGKVRVSADYLETTSEKVRRVHCGSASAPFISFEGPSLSAGADGATHETVDCRTVQTENGFGALESTLETDGQKMTAAMTIGGVVLARRETPIKAGDKPSERYAFTMLGSARGVAGSVYVARFNGSVVVARRLPEGPSDASFWLGTATNPPAVTLDPDGEHVAVWTTLMAKPELYATRFLYGKKSDAPKPVAIADATAVEERSAVFALARAADTLVVNAEKVGGKRVTKLRRVDAEGKVLGTTGVGADDETVQEAKLVALPSGDVLLVYVALDRAKGYVIKRSILGCGDAPAP